MTESKYYQTWNPLLMSFFEGYFVYSKLFQNVTGTSLKFLRVLTGEWRARNKKICKWSFTSYISVKKVKVFDHLL